MTSNKMPPTSKVHTPKSNFRKSLHDNSLLIKPDSITSTEDNELTTVFKDFQISALYKAISVSPKVEDFTLRDNSVLKHENKVNVICDKKKDELTENELICENSFSYQKLIQNCDLQRRLTVDKVMRERIQNMYDTGKLIHDSLEHLKQTKQEEVIARRLLLESKIINDVQEQETLNKPKREAQWIKDNLKEAQRIQERNQKVKEAEEEAKKKSEALLVKRKLIDKILFELLKQYNPEYENLFETIKLHKDKVALTELTTSHSKTLKECAGVFMSLLKKCNQGNVVEEDLELSKKLVKTIKSIHEYFLREITKMNEPSNPEAEKIEKNQVSSSEVNESSPESDNLSDYYDTKSFHEYTTLKTNLESFEKSIAPLVSDESMKKFKFNCQKAVTIPVNAISPVSSSHLCDKYMKLHNLLSGRTVEVGDNKFSASQHPLGISFCKNLLAKKFVRQGDLTVSSKPDAAFSIAAVLVSLWVDFPDFGQLVLGHFHAICPYLVPMFMPQLEGQSNEDYHKTLGYHYSETGDVEKQDSFLKRMSGIMRLYAALLISKPKQADKINPLGLSEGWRWISALLNLEPRPDICATLLYDFLEVAGNELFRAYGGQFKKLLAYVCQEYFPKLEKVTPSIAGGPIVRLEGFLQKILKEEYVPSPHGVLPPNFW